MALEEKDLQAISELLDRKFERELYPIKKDISEIKEDVTELKEDVVVLKEDVTGLKEDIVVLKEDVVDLREDVTGLKEDVSSLDKQINDMNKKVDHMDDQLKRMEFSQEQEIIPKLCMLYETFVPTNRITRLEEEMDTVKEDVSLLKKAVERHGIDLYAVTV